MEVIIFEAKQQAEETQLSSADFSAAPDGSPDVSADVFTEVSPKVSVPVVSEPATSVPDVSMGNEVSNSAAPEKTIPEVVTEFANVPKPVKNPRGYAGIGSLLAPKPKSNPRR